jgi:hypothetical protein
MGAQCDGRKQSEREDTKWGPNWGILISFFGTLDKGKIRS